MKHDVHKMYDSKYLGYDPPIPASLKSVTTKSGYEWQNGRGGVAGVEGGPGDVDNAPHPQSIDKNK